MSTSSKQPDCMDVVRQYSKLIKKSAENLELERNGRKRDILLELTEGFYAGNWKDDEFEPEDGGAASCDPKHPNSIAAAEFAISKLNKRKRKNLKGKNLKVKEIVRVNWNMVSGVLYFVTLKASNDRFYEAKVLDRRGNRKELLFIRPARHYPKVNPEFLIYDAPHASRND